MKIVIAIDSFKGSLSSTKAAQAIKNGIIRVCDADIIISPIADGGEGTVDALTTGLNGTFKSSEVTGPLGQRVTATWGTFCCNNIKTAVIEMSCAAGITLLNQNELNPLLTTTFGVGELINEAINEGCRKFIIGLGGSATNDGGVGMLQALGYEFFDANNTPIARGAKGLEALSYISAQNVNPMLSKCNFRIACDVNNPLCGKNGCSMIFGPQKGATNKMIEDMDKWLRTYADLSKGDPNFPGAGAAGGMGYAFHTFTNAQLESGIDIIISETNLEEKIKTADIVITGEGKIDSQTVMGKAPIGVAKIAKKYGKKVIAFCGCATEDSRICNSYGIDAIFPILTNITTLKEAMSEEYASSNLEMTAEQVFRLLV